MCWRLAGSQLEKMMLSTELMIRHQVSSLLNMDGSYACFYPLGSRIPHLESVTLCW
uniref:GekBS106P n=1 Tax=Gekko japonicus TaxID=146911 RepID=Q5EI45_GEKJA|nr:GekBS106P [Gekko japonicus]